MSELAQNVRSYLSNGGGVTTPAMQALITRYRRYTDYCTQVLPDWTTILFVYNPNGQEDYYQVCKCGKHSRLTHTLTAILDFDKEIRNGTRLLA